MENLIENKSKILKVTFLATMLLTGEKTCGMESGDSDNNCMCCQKCCESCKECLEKNENIENENNGNKDEKGDENEKKENEQIEMSFGKNLGILPDSWDKYLKSLNLPKACYDQLINVVDEVKKNKKNKYAFKKEEENGEIFIFKCVITFVNDKLNVSWQKGIKKKGKF